MSLEGSPSDQFLTGARVRALVACPTCGANQGRPCRVLYDGPLSQIVGRENHLSRALEARAVVRELRLGPVRPS